MELKEKNVSNLQFLIENKNYDRLKELLKNGYIPTNNDILFVLQFNYTLADIIIRKRYDLLDEYI